MFGKKKEVKVKETSHRDLLLDRIASEVEQLTQGQSLIYKLPEFYWSGFAAFLVAEPNPTYPQKGKKFTMHTDRIVDGKPAGNKGTIWQSDKPREIAQWMADRDAFRGSIERYQ